MTTMKIDKDAYGNYRAWLDSHNIEVTPKECCACLYGTPSPIQGNTTICHYDPHSGPHHDLYWCSKWEVRQ